MAYQRQLRQTIVLENNENYILSINVPAISGTSLLCNLAGTGYTIGTNGWHNFTVFSTGTQTEISLEPDTDSNHTLNVGQVILKKYLW